MAQEEDVIRVLRIIEIIGKREWVERTVENSVHGTKTIRNRGQIRAATIGAYPEILTSLSEDERAWHGPRPEDARIGES